MADKNGRARSSSVAGVPTRSAVGLGYRDISLFGPMTSNGMDGDRTYKMSGVIMKRGDVFGDFTTDNA